LNKKSRSNGGVKRRTSFEEGATAPQSSGRSGGSNYYDNRRSPNRSNHSGGVSHFQGLHDKNMNLAREALSDGDRVAAEYYFQNAEHYQRMMNGRRRHPVEFVSPSAETQEATPQAETVDAVNVVAEPQVEIDEPTQPLVSEEPIS
jgi:hypothetical protein